MSAIKLSNIHIFHSWFFKYNLYPPLYTIFLFSSVKTRYLTLLHQEKEFLISHKKSDIQVTKPAYSFFLFA